MGIRVGFLVKVIQPFVQKLIIWEEIKTHGYLALIIVIVMGTDFILTIFSVGKLQMSTKSWNERLNTRMKLDEGKLNQEEMVAFNLLVLNHCCYRSLK